MIGSNTGRVGITVLAGICIALGACAGEVDTDTALVDTTVVAGATMEGAWSNEDIVNRVSAANAAEIATSLIAVERAQNAEVRDFAQRMIDEHQAAQGQVDTLAAQLGLAVAPPAMDTLQQAFERRREALQAQQAGPEFDREYMSMQVDLHQATIDMLNQAMTATQTAELQTLLQELMPTIQAHLDAARQIQQQLGTTTG